MGTLFRAPAHAIYLIGGLWGLLLNLAVLHDIAGGFGILVGFFLAPVTLYIVPFYAGFAHHDWFPLLVGYGATLEFIVLQALATLIERRRP